MGREKFDAPAMFVTADMVILAADALGTTEILLRSKEAGLKLSDRLGEKLFGQRGTCWDSDTTSTMRSGVLGPETDHRKKWTLWGPCITGIIDLRDSDELDDGYVIEEGSIAGAMGTFLPPAMALGARLIGRDTDRGFRDWIRERFRVLNSLIRGVYHGAMRNTQTEVVPKN